MSSWILDLSSVIGSISFPRKWSLNIFQIRLVTREVRFMFFICSFICHFRDPRCTIHEFIGIYLNDRDKFKDFTHKRTYEKDETYFTCILYCFLWFYRRISCFVNLFSCIPMKLQASHLYLIAYLLLHYYSFLWFLFCLF